MKISIIITSRIQGNVNHRLPYLLESLKEYSRDTRNFEVLIKFDDDDELAPQVINGIQRTGYPFPIKYAVGPRGRGYIDIHKGYNQLLQMVHEDSEIIGAMADDFRVERDWDVAVLNAAQGAGDYFIIHQRPHPRPDWGVPFGQLLPHMTTFNMDNNMFESENLHIIDEAPLWSRKLIRAVGYFPVSFTDAWTICLEYCLWQGWKVDITKFLDKIYINRYTSEVDQPGNERWNTDRKTNFDYIKSKEFKEIVLEQAGIIEEAIYFRSNK